MCETQGNRKVQKGFSFIATIVNLLSITDAMEIIITLPIAKSLPYSKSASLTQRVLREEMRL